MVWLHPAVLIGLIALAGPIAVHLLRRRHARRIVVPSVRFIEAADRSAVRLRRISDPLLLLIRAGIVACAVLALARPLFLTEPRIAAWSTRTARAVISESSGGARSAAASDTIAAQLSGANPVDTLETSDLRLGVRRAAGWLAVSPPVQREIVIVSDFRRGAIDDETFARVPNGIGIRFVRISTESSGALEPIALLDAGGSVTVVPQIDRSSTRLSYSRRPEPLSGLRILAPSFGDDARRALLRVVGKGGAFAPAAEQPITIEFDEAAQPVAVTQDDAWSFGAAQRLLRAASNLGAPLSVSASGGSLAVHAQTDPKSLTAAQIVQATLDSRLPLERFERREPERIDDTTLARWSRAPGAPDVSQWRQSDESDGRWLWVAALVLLALESYFRRAPNEKRQVLDHAA